MFKIEKPKITSELKDKFILIKLLKNLPIDLRTFIVINITKNIDINLNISINLYILFKKILNIS